MRGTVLYAPHDVRLEQRDDPEITRPTDAIIRIAATCVCGSDLWDYRGVNPVNEPIPIGHEYCGIVEEVGRDVATIKSGQFVIGSFFASDNTCPQLPRRIPQLMPAPRVRRRRPGRTAAGSAG
jgi:threonine dehydrogenase-like Zn-dependent dehydrogenase